MSARRKRVISTEEIQFNHKPAKMLLTEKRRESAKMAKSQGEIFFFILTFSQRALYSYNHPANHMNICISLNLAINSPIETGCHNDNLNMKRGTENCRNNNFFSDIFHLFCAFVLQHIWIVWKYLCGNHDYAKSKKEANFVLKQVRRPKIFFWCSGI